MCFRAYPLISMISCSRPVGMLAGLVGCGMLVALSLAGCGSSQPTPDLPGLYNQSAQYHGPERNPVIVIPGLLGSELVQEETERIVWGAFRGDAANPNDDEGARLISLPMEQDAPLHTLRDDVYPNGALREFRMRVLGLPINLQAYQSIMQTLGVGGYRDDSGSLGAIDYGDEHFTCFQFDYDWRRDNVENAQRLHDFIQEKTAYLQEEYAQRYGVEDADIQFDIVAHSMGGLLTRYYLRYGNEDLPADGSAPEITWAGAEHVSRAVLVGTPNAGSAKALRQMVEGKRTSRITPNYAPAILGTMPAGYQLLPRGRHGALVDAEDPSVVIDSLFAPDFWQRMEWGLADPEQDEVLQQLLPNVEDAHARRRIALDHQRKSLERARQFTAALDTAATPPPTTEIALIAGDAEPTLARLAVDRTTGTLSDAGEAPGDGTVLRSSALMDERVNGTWQPTLNSPIQWSQVTFLFADHIDMTRDPAFTDNLLYYLLEAPRRPAS